MTALIVAVVVGSGFLTFLLAAAFLGNAPRRLDEAVRDLLVVATHPDDCVVTCGEYALAALASGRSVRVTYVTCGDREATLPLARARRAEALEAWSAVGLAESSITFLDLPESPIDGPTAASPEMVAAARARLQAEIGALPSGAAVFFPAGAEAHVDHEQARRATLEAVLASGRADLRLFEAPEYNDLISLRGAPKVALAHLAGAVPGLGRLARRMDRWRHSAPSFADGGRGVELPPDAVRLRQKVAMLRTFRSQDPEFLVRYFGRPDRFRPVSSAEAALRERVSGYVRVGDRRLAPSTALFLGCLLFVLASLAALASVGITLAPYGRTLAGLGALLVAIVATARRHSLEKRLAFVAIAGGLCVGALFPELHGR